MTIEDDVRRACGFASSRSGEGGDWPAALALARTARGRVCRGEVAAPRSVARGVTLRGTRDGAGGTGESSATAAFGSASSRFTGGDAGEAAGKAGGGGVT